MKMFIIVLDNGEYVIHGHLTSNYCDYERTGESAIADRFNDFDSRLIVKRLRAAGQQASRKEVSSAAAV